MANDLEKIDVNINDETELMQYGNEALSEIREISNKISNDLDSHSDNTQLLDNLNKLLNSIDYDELKMVTTEEKSGIKKLINKVLSKKDKVITKYVGISKRIDGMYAGIKEWESNLLKNNKSINEIEQVINQIENNIKLYIDNSKEVIKRIESNEEYGQHKKDIVTQNLQEFHYAINTCQQMKETIKIKKKMNNNIYMKLNSVYSTTMPIIHSQINLIETMRESRDFINGLKIIDEQRDSLLKFGAEESIRLGKEAVNQIGKNKEDFELLDETIKELQDGIQEIKELERKKYREIQETIDKEEGVKYEEIIH